jgi:sigma-54 dependent transcriptional regulator, acetoin dehydrogenase operon transcriptional activator AcoR
MQLSQDFNRHREQIYAIISGKETTTPVDSVISASWHRCVQDYGLDPTEKHEPVRVDRSQLCEQQERLGRMLPIARAEMANLYQQIAGTGHSIILTNTSGVVLNYVGDPGFDEEATRNGLWEGAIWSEQHQGTNGMGTCLAERRPVIVHHDEHFFTGHLSLSCAATPIMDPNNELIAVLDASSESRNVQHHTMALVNMSAKTIENRVFLCMYRNHFILRFHSRPEFVTTLGEGLIAFQADGKILATNGSTLFQLGYDSPDEIRTGNIDDLFDTPVCRLLQHASAGTTNPLPVHDTRNARRFFTIIQMPESEQARSHCAPSPDAVERSNKSSPVPELHTCLEFGDSVMAQNIRIALRVLDRNIPILIKGESGTGKGVFAKTMHEASDRADKPFVAINCASIPESLIESELFGYKAGAFTGASRQGSAGKIVQADGGTLFLDEIGDMPLSLQARLLRVLEEKEVVPLGAHTPVTVDLRVISATHQNLLGMVKEGTFREDLYYRLQGITVTLPPLRERTDKRNLIEHLVTTEIGDDSRIQIDEQVIERFNNYYWPGNIRQMRNVLRTMLALSDSSRLTVDDIVDDLFRDAPGSQDGQDSAPCEQLLQQCSDPLLSAEREALLAELERHRWNISRAAKRLGLSRNTLYRKMKRCNISAPRN